VGKLVKMSAYCNRWPQCGCGYDWRRWQLIAEDEEWTPNQLVLDSAEIEIRNFLSCISERCPDPAFRKAATVQLMKPIFGGVTGDDR
jgi:hypothetical protein